MHSVKGQSLLIKLLSVILIALLFRLIINIDTNVHVYNDEEWEAVEAASNSIRYSQVSDYPDLYASSEQIPTKLPAGRKVVYLTFDDGPSVNTEKVLDILDEQNVKATFFIMGCGVGEAGRERLKRISDSGHTIGIHTFSHDYKDIYSSVNSYLEDFEKVYKLINETTGLSPNIFRFPGGSNNRYFGKQRTRIIEEMTRRGFTYYDWTVSAEDSVGKPTKASINKYLSLAYNYSYPVILMHDSASNKLTTTVLSDFISNLKAAGYEFDTLDNRVPIHY